MEEIKIIRSSEPPVIFEGELIASVKQKRLFFFFKKSIDVYNLRSGKFVSVVKSLGPCDNICTKVYRHDNLDKIIFFFGQGKMERELYEKLGIKNEERLD